MPLEFGTTMKAIRSALVAVCFLPTVGGVMHSQTAGKAVITPAPSTSAPRVPAPAPVTGPIDNATYVIGADDQIQVTVWENAQLSATCVVRPDGKISLPLLDDVQAAGFTPTQLADDLTKRLKDIVKEPHVGVTVLAVRSKNVYMMGEFNHVGPIQIAPGMTVLQAIATAGGVGPYANTKKMYILRGDPGHQKQIHFDYKKAIKGDMQGITLQPGDTIFVP